MERGGGHAKEWEMENFLTFSLVQLGLSCVQVVNCFLEYFLELFLVLVLVLVLVFSIHLHFHLHRSLLHFFCFGFPLADGFPHSSLGRRIPSFFASEKTEE